MKPNPVAPDHALMRIDGIRNRSGASLLRNLAKTMQRKRMSGAYQGLIQELI